MSEALVPILHAKNAHENAEWYRRLGFEVEGEHQFASNMPYYLFLRRGDILLHLSEHKGDAKKGAALLYFYVDDVDALAVEFGETVRDQPWGCREISIKDPDGNRLRIGMRASEK
jgi:catechol 2,3-dioxygenase-like lactoylglutathione lyase family enzyme